MLSILLPQLLLQQLTVGGCVGCPVGELLGLAVGGGVGSMDGYKLGISVGSSRIWTFTVKGVFFVLVMDSGSVTDANPLTMRIVEVETSGKKPSLSNLTI